LLKKNPSKFSPCAFVAPNFVPNFVRPSSFGYGFGYGEGRDFYGSSPFKEFFHDHNLFDKKKNRKNPIGK
jgi:hypothetical protein